MSKDDSTSVVSNILSSTTEKFVDALVKTPSAVMGVDHEDTTTLLHSTNPPGVTSEPQWSRCSGWNSTEFSSSFLEHASGQGISGACAWAAILITCHQVGLNIL